MECPGHYDEALADFRDACLRVVEAGSTFLLMAYSPDCDPLGLVEISRAEAIRLRQEPPSMRHVWRAVRERTGVCMEPVEWPP